MRRSLLLIAALGAVFAGVVTVPAAATSSAARANALVRRWERVTTCQELVHRGLAGCSGVPRSRLEARPLRRVVLGKGPLGVRFDRRRGRYPKQPRRLRNLVRGRIDVVVQMEDVVGVVTPLNFDEPVVIWSVGGSHGLADVVLV
jgi:hypothetical protein